MKLSPLVLAAYCAATASAIGGSNGPGKPKRPIGRPERIASWKWTNPFATDALAARYDAACTAEKKFQAREYLLDDLSIPPPKGLGPYMEALKELFSTRQYPGSWDGIDPHGYDRNLLEMNYADVPVAVREWIEDQDRTKGAGHGLFAVYNIAVAGTKVVAGAKVGEVPTPRELRTDDKFKTVIFAPGAVYEILPLWVAEDSDCADWLKDLEKYTPDLADGAVIAYPVSKTRAQRAWGEREVEFTVKAQVLKIKPGVVEEAKEEPKKAEEEAKNVEDDKKADESKKEEETKKAEEVKAEEVKAEEVKKDEL